MPGKSGRDWTGKSRQEQVNTGRRFVNALMSEIEDAGGQKVRVKTFLGVPEDELTKLVETWNAAEAALKNAILVGRGDKATSGAVKGTFPPFMTQLRRVKNGWIHIPPATSEIMRLFGLSEPDKSPTRTGEPSGMMTAAAVKREPAAITFRFIYVAGDENDPANRSRRLWYKVVAQGEKPPESPEELTKSVPANRVTETLRLDYKDSGKRVFVAVQLENGDFVGPFGPMNSFIIP